VGGSGGLNNVANRFSIQITAADLPRCARSYLFALQQASFNQPLDGVVTDAAYSRSFTQTHSLQIGAELGFDRQSNGYAGLLLHGSDSTASLCPVGFIISLIFGEQRKLVFRATPLQN
jgi:hypothetical protein